MTRAEIDNQLDATLTRLHRMRWVSLFVLVLLILGSIGTGGYVIYTQQQELQASCAFYRELGTINIAPPPHAPKPGRLAVQLVVHSRFAYGHEGCGPLPPPDPALRKYAAEYKIAVNP